MKFPKMGVWAQVSASSEAITGPLMVRRNFYFLSFLGSALVSTDVISWDFLVGWLFLVVLGVELSFPCTSPFPSWQGAAVCLPHAGDAQGKRG